MPCQKALWAGDLGLYELLLLYIEDLSLRGVCYTHRLYSTVRYSIGDREASQGDGYK